MSRKKTVQDFQFGSRLGEGSYSQVFKGVDVSSRKVFAIKVLSKKHIVKEKKIKYVNIEKITLNRLGRHPGIVTLYYTFQDDNSLYFVIDLAEHGELLTLIRKLGSLSETCSKYYMIQLIDAVDFMHKKGVIHRDLKPENILLNGDMKLMITDFGAAKILDLDDSGNVVEDEEAFVKGSFVGTAEYVSPELLKHNKCGFESDVWAIGCILYQFVVGVPPFKGKSEYATFEKIVNLQFQWPNYFIPELIKDVVSRLLRSDPQERLTMYHLQQHPWFSRLNWEDKSKIWGVPPPKMEQYRPIVEQQLQQNTPQMNKVMVQKKLPSSTVKKQLLSNTINQIRSDTGNNHLYIGVNKDSPRKPTPIQQSQFLPPIKPVNGIAGLPKSSNGSPISPSMPMLPQIQPMSPHYHKQQHQRPQIPQQQQFTPPRPNYPHQQQASAQRTPTEQQRPSQFSQPRLLGQSPASPSLPSNSGSPIGVKAPTLPIIQTSQQVQQSPTRLREVMVERSAPQLQQAPTISKQSAQKISPSPPPVIKASIITPVSSPVAISSEPMAPILGKDDFKQQLQPVQPLAANGYSSPSSPASVSANESVLRVANALDSPVPPAVPAKSPPTSTTPKAVITSPVANLQQAVSTSRDDIAPAIIKPQVTSSVPKPLISVPVIKQQETSLPSKAKAPVPMVKQHDPSSSPKNAAPVPPIKVRSKPNDVKPQKVVSKPVTKAPQLSLPPQPKSTAPRSRPPKLQPPSIVTKSTPSPVISRPMPKPRSSPSPITSPRIPSKSTQSNGTSKGPTEVLRCLTKDEHIVKLDFIDFAELDYASLRTFDPTSNLSKLSKNLGLDDVLIHEIISKNKKELENGTKRVVLVITDFGNLFLFTCTNVQQLTYEMGIDLTDKMFAMYDYEFSEYDQSGYLILEVLKMDKLVFLSPLEKQVKKDLIEVATIQQGTSLSWIDALMKTKELLKKKATAAAAAAASNTSTPSPKSASASSTRGTTPTNTSSNSVNTNTNTNTTSTRKVSSSSTIQSKTVPRVVVRNTSTSGKKPKTTQQIQQQNKKFAGGAAAAAFKSAR